jgi:F420-dependent oxidoreductase-like protein
MRIGINGTGLVQKASVDAIVEDVRRAHADGYASYWLAEHPTGGLDALTVLTAAGLAVPDIELGTAVVPTFPRHPMALAGQALTARAAVGDRLVLGVGLSHAVMMGQLGIPFDKPIRHLKEFLSILVPLLDEGRVDFTGETLRCEADAFFESGAHFPVLVAALGPQALKVAGRMTDGTTLAWVGPRTIREHIVPGIAEAAAAAGRPAPRVVATLPVCVTDQPDAVRARISETLAMYAKLPSYAAMFEREGVSTPGELAIVGSEDEVRDGLGRLAEAGVTDFGASVFPTSRDEAVASRDLLDRLAAEAAA